jgi:nucleotide-binding universal stress UspA family protein
MRDRVMSDPEGPSGSGDAPAARVVVGVDGSPGGMRALAWAAREARLRNATLEVVHVAFFRHEASEVFAPGILHDEASALVEAVNRAEALEPGIDVVGRVCDPPAAEALIAASHDADMLVVGSRGLSALKELTLGSVSRECAHRARCAVVVIPHDFEVAHRASGDGP